MPHINKKRNAFQFPREALASLPGVRMKANGFFTYIASGGNKHFRAWGHVSGELCEKIIRKTLAEKLMHDVPMGTFLIQRQCGAVKRWAICGPKEIVEQIAA